jgi:hypothetical protein
MAESNVVKTRRDATIRLDDGTGTPLTYTVTIEEGTYQYTPGKPDRIVVRDRHAIAGLRKGADPIGQASFSVHFREFTNAALDGTLIDFLEQRSKFASFISTASSAYEFKLFDLIYTVEGTDHGDAADHEETLTDCFGDWDFGEGDLDVVNVTIEVYGTHTETGPA